MRIGQSGVLPWQTDKATALSEIARLDQQLERRFSDRIVLEPALSRSLVSFQANKSRWVHSPIGATPFLDAPLLGRRRRRYYLSAFSA